MSKKRYIGEIDFFKFIMALVIMLMHISQRNQHYSDLFPMGGLACEFFFAVSGYFMCVSVSKRKNDLSDLGGETIQFVWGKFKKIAFPCIASFTMVFAIWAYGKGMALYTEHGISAVLNKILCLVPNGMLLFMSFGVDDAITNITWYISVMLLAMLYLYPLARRFGRNFNLIFAANIVFIGTSYIYLSVGQFKVMHGQLGLTTGGMLRGTIDMCLGCMIYEFSNYIKQKEFKTGQKVLLSFADLFLLGCIFFIYLRGTRKSGFTMLILLFFLLSIMTSGQNYCSRFFNNRVSKLLGRLSLYIYLLHIVARKVFYHYYPDATLKFAMMAIISMTAVLVIAVMFAEAAFNSIRSGKHDAGK